jgi:protein-S-isoprenylcysteine O-methyltransferase Ste14
MSLDDASRAPWWTGTRGEWFVFGQLGLFLLVALGPRTAPWLPEWSAVARQVSWAVGTALVVGGLVWIVTGAVQLGRWLTAFPCPKDGAPLLDTGAFALVRHPMYCGAIWAAVGWALSTGSLLTLGYAVLLAVFFDVKASREERWLAATFPEYDRYRARVRKLIPFVH